MYKFDLDLGGLHRPRTIFEEYFRSEKEFAGDQEEIENHTEFRGRLYKAFRQLTPTKREILGMLYGFRDGNSKIRRQLFKNPAYSVDQVAASFKKEIKYVVAEEKAAIRKIKAKMEELQKEEMQNEDQDFGAL